MKSKQLRDMIDKYDMYLAHDGQDIGLRRKPDNIEELKRLKPQLLAELQKIEEEKKIAGDPRVGQLSLSYYYGDWYRANSIFKTEKFGGNQPNWGNNSNIFSNMELNKICGHWFEKDQTGRVDSERIVRKLSDFFDCDLNTKKEDLQKKYPELTITMHSYDDMRGKGEYISEIIFPDFQTFEKYVRQAFESTIQKREEIKKEIEAIFEKAKKTGEAQLIESFPVDCDDPDEECSTDLISIYAMPDGTKKTKRIHTY